MARLNSCKSLQEALVSVIVPTFNRHDSLKVALETIKKQTYANIETIVVNDNLKDDFVLGIVKNVGLKKYKVIYNERTKGGNGARNTGILHASGAFVAFLDDDDEWLENKIHEQVACLNSRGSTWGGVYGAYEVRRRGRWKTNRASKEGAFVIELLAGEAPVCAGSTLLVRSEVFDRIGLFDEALQRHQDLEFLVRFFGRYLLCSVPKRIARINGHNPPPACRAEAAKKVFFQAVEHSLKPYPTRLRAKVFFFHFRELGILYGREGNVGKTLQYTGRAISVCPLCAYRIVTPLYYMMCGIVDRWIVQKVQRVLMRNQIGGKK